MKPISILGCGWLGLPLAKALLKANFPVKGSTTTEAKLALLSESAVDPFLLTLDSHTIQGDLDAFLKESAILILAIPPKIRNNQSQNFVTKIEQLIPWIEKANIQKVLFISSTSVYGDDSGLVTEETPPKPNTESGKQLLVAEQLLQNNSHFDTTIVRFGGLIGPDRHPVHFLAAKTSLENPSAVINLIHQEDCIGIILKIIQTHAWGDTFNAVTPYHPSRQNYYRQKAADLNLVFPKFANDSGAQGKIISSEKIQGQLQYTFIQAQL